MVGSYEARSAPRYDVVTRVETGGPADLHHHTLVENISDNILTIF